MYRTIGKWPLLAGLTLVLLAPAQIGSGQGNASPTAPYAADDKPFGMSLAEWDAAWYQWWVSIPTATAPATGSGRAFGGVGQRMPVWFLPRYRVDKTVSATVPAGYALFVPVVSYIAEDFVGTVKLDFTVNKAHQITQALDQLPVPTADIDGVAIPDMARYRVQTSPFSFLLPEGNILGRTDVPTGGTSHEQAIAEGYNFLVPPLPVGKHVIHLQTNEITDKPPAVVANITYQLTIKDWPH